MRKQEKQRKKDEERKTKTEKDDTETTTKKKDMEKISEMVENVKLDESNVSQAHL